MSETVFYLPGWAVTEADFRALASGQVPEWLADACRRCVEWDLETGPRDFIGRREQQQTRTRTTRKKQPRVVVGAGTGTAG